jgi:hypothetical protein
LHFISIMIRKIETYYDCTARILDTLKLPSWNVFAQYVELERNRPLVARFHLSYIVPCFVRPPTTTSMHMYYPYPL